MRWTPVEMPAGPAPEGLPPSDRLHHRWDLGLLAIEPDMLRYRGEQASFELPRPAVRAIEIGARTPSWIRAPRVIVRWSTAGGEEALTLRHAGARRVSAIGPASQALAAQLREWLGDPDATPGSEVGALAAAHHRSPPGIGPVTSRAPAEAAALRDLPVLLVVVGLLSAGASLLFGLGPARGFDVFVAALLAQLAARWPALRWRERPADRSIEQDVGRRCSRMASTWAIVDMSISLLGVSPRFQAAGSGRRSPVGHGAGWLRAAGRIGAAPRFRG
jgi:hypothetical protein